MAVDSVWGPLCIIVSCVEGENVDLKLQGLIFVAEKERVGRGVGQRDMWFLARYVVWFSHEFTRI